MPYVEAYQLDEGLGLHVIRTATPCPDACHSGRGAWAALTQFLSQLERLFVEAKEKHSVFVTAKRCSRADVGAQSTTPTSVLFRATDGKSTGRTKISTVVRIMLLTKIPPDQILEFREAYGTLMRAQLAEILKKRDKAKERRVDKLLAASRKKLAENGGRVLIRGAST